MIVHVLALYATAHLCGIKDEPRLVVADDNTRITVSCTVVIPRGAVLADPDGNGVIHVDADDVHVRFEDGSVLRGADANTPGNELTGIGIAINNRRNVRLIGASVSGYKVGILARGCSGLRIERSVIRDNYRQRLKSTPRAEDQSDWLWPHNNDKQEWRHNYGAAVCVENSERITLCGIIVRESQNGIIIDRVNDSCVFDNDCSFLSGWGLAMWRSSRNTISRNAFDFCIRGYSHGVYNRGQDSAGILCFEQCRENRFLSNSATHSGDGFFGFAGKEALGETPPPGSDFNYAEAGCDGNVFIGNDFSYAAAHGLELTFSKGATIARNRFEDNAICGIWGGYSNDCLILSNEFVNNGGMAYGLERGGINIEHGSGHIIADNTFINNAAAVHLWWDNDGTLLSLPGVKARYRGVRDNQIRGNVIHIEKDPGSADNPRARRLVGLQIRAPKDAPVGGNVYANNTVRVLAANADEKEISDGVLIVETAAGDVPIVGDFRIDGDSKPVGARETLRGRRNIIMGEWGPWDHETPFVRPGGTSANQVTYEIFGGSKGNWEYKDLLSGESSRWAVGPAPANPLKIVINSPNGVLPYKYEVSDGRGWSRVLEGTVVGASWTVKCFSWDDSCDPRKNVESWRRRAEGDDVLVADPGSLSLVFGHGGPRDIKWVIKRKEPATDVVPGKDRFGTIASAKMGLPKGAWRITTLSDDGVRVMVNGRTIIERWDWHAPTRDDAVYEQHKDGEIEIVVEHFEIDGYAVLTLDIEEADERQR